MKIEFCVFLLFMNLLGSSQARSTENDCNKQSDCAVGCLDQNGLSPLCLPIGKVKLKDGMGTCRSPIGGLACGCKLGKCKYGLPQDFSDSRQEANSERGATEGATEGNSAGGSVVGALKCCQGLTLTNSWIHQHLDIGCDAPAAPGSAGFCVKCGDGVCDSKHYENKCHSPQDYNKSLLSRLIV